MRALLVDDDQAFCDLLRTYLEHLDIAVDLVHTGQSALWACHQFHYDIVLLDIMLPGIDGYEVLSQLQEFSQLPVILLTAKGGDDDRVRGLDAGADDYLAKPFSSRELVARMRAVLRRGKVEMDFDTVKFRNSGLDWTNGKVIVNGRAVSLTNVEETTLTTLLKSIGKPVSRDHLYEAVFKRENSPFDRSLDTHICNLRKKLGARVDGTPRITAVRGVGYRYCP